MVWHRTPACPLPACRVLLASTAGCWGVRVQGAWRLARPLSMLLRRPVHPTNRASRCTCSHHLPRRCIYCHRLPRLAHHCSGQHSTTVGPARAVLPECQALPAAVGPCHGMSTCQGLNPDYSLPNMPAGTQSTPALPTDTTCKPGRQVHAGAFAVGSLGSVHFGSCPPEAGRILPVQLQH